MASSTYALPVSPITHTPHTHYRQHSHGGHTHSHSHSHNRSSSPSKLAPAGSRPAYTPKTPLAGNMHSRTQSAHLPNHLANLDVDPHTVSPVRELSPAPSGDGRPVGEEGEDSPYQSNQPTTPLYSEFTGVDFSKPAENHPHNGHAHHGHSHGDHGDHGDHDDHDDHVCSGHHPKAVEPRSRFTTFMLKRTLNFPLLQSILLEKDSRRIFYFMNLNFAFMMVQAFYGFVTDSLGLLSDSIHMLFDCIALALGLFAAVSSKWPASQRFPYGFGKIESLSGFGNGVFLMLISVEIIIEAIERLAEGHETKRLTELFIVSSMGLAVNLVGMACFGHHHHGHDHSHGGHSHGEEKHDHKGHGHDCDSDIPLISGAADTTEKHSHGHSHGHSHDHSHGHSHGHGHSHDNENMRGIFLHVLADTMGSAAVIVSTVLIHFLGWPGWDPLASCLIAILIFLSSLPLVSSCAKRLLLTIPADTEYKLRETLSGVSDLRGVASYSVPRFWMADSPDLVEGEPILGAMHVIATRGSQLDDVRERTRTYLLGHGMDVVVQVEREGDAKCWCGGDNTRSPANATKRF